MDYIGNKCPVCDKYFHAHDDIVVCPECGTPHHRECYESNGKCFNFDKHKDNYDYQEDIKEKTYEKDEGITICKKCGAKNSESAFFCSKCGNSLSETVQNAQQNVQQPYSGTSQQGTPPFAGNPNVILFDPLAGVNPSTDLGDGITAGETAKFVKQNTPYFITVFNNIKKFSKSRYNFCAMLFGGGYLLFRKMYKIGSIITAIQAVMLILYFYLNYFIVSNNQFDKLFEASQQGDYKAFEMYLAELPDNLLAVFILFVMIAITIFITNIVIGACANRMYYNHCKSRITKIKNEVTDSSKVGETLSKCGGVNAPLALSLWITYIIVSYLPVFF